MNLKQIETEAGDTRHSRSSEVADRKEATTIFQTKPNVIRKLNCLTMIIGVGCSFQLLSIPKPRARKLEGLAGAQWPSCFWCRLEHSKLGVGRKFLRVADKAFIKPAIAGQQESLVLKATIFPRQEQILQDYLVIFKA